MGMAGAKKEKHIIASGEQAAKHRFVEVCGRRYSMVYLMPQSMPIIPALNLP
jgi:hypothetical protein